MKKEEIHFGDIKRWLFGQAPPEFMIEVFIRTVIIMVLLLITVRLMGKRMSGQITITEFAVMVTLGAIVSPVMQLPDRGIIYGFIALLAALAFQRSINTWAVKNENVEHTTQGMTSLLIKDGIINLEELEKTRITKQQLYAMLREKKILNLGKVKRAYLEACGILSVYETEAPKPGLPLAPPIDDNINDMQFEVDGMTRACCNCGNVQQVLSERMRCRVCNQHEWESAYLLN